MVRGEIGSGTVGRIASLLFIAAGVLTVVTLPLPQPPGMNAPATFLVGLTAILVGGATYITRWERWPRAASLVLVPPAFALIALGNAFGSVRPYSYSVFFIVTFAWLGLGHPRWTSVSLAPLAAVAYIVPMLVRPGASRADATGALFTIPACVLVAEVIGWTVARERRSREGAKALALVSSELARSLDEERLGQTIVDGARHALACEHAVLLRIDPGTMACLTYHASGLPEHLRSAVARLRGVTLDDLPPAFLNGEPMVVPDTAGLTPLSELVRTFGVKSFIAVPVIARGRSIAMLTCWESTYARRYDEEDLRLAHALAGQASTAIENARLYEKTLDASRRDALTNLGNRRAFRETLEKEAERATRHARPLSLVVLDCDGFKHINDSRGHEWGDRVLQHLGEILESKRRTEDSVFRVGGDEFAILLPETRAAGGAVIAERVRLAVQQAEFAGETSGPVTVSLGVAVHGEHGTTSDGLFERADAAMYEVKRAGGNATAFPSRPSSDGSLGVDVHRLIERRLLRSRLQPIFNLGTGHVIGFETLVELDPAAGHAPLATSYRAAERAGRVADVDRIARDVALATAEGLQRDELLFVNVTSSALLSTPSFADEFSLQLEAHGIRRDQAVLELSRDGRASRDPALARALRSCVTAGIALALDDFSGGPSDLDLLSALPFESIKVEVSLRSGPGTDHRWRGVLRGLTGLVRETGARPVATGIQSFDALQQVLGAGFAAGQGPFLRAPADSLDRSPRPLGLLVG
jgi:diguanylate cyclase (GGDEF)-like protein